MLPRGWSRACSSTADLGERELKGFAAAVRCWRIVGETAAESRFEARHAVLAPLVGRAGRTRLPARALASRNIGKGPSRAAERRGRHRQVAPGGGACRAGSPRSHMPNCAISAPPITPTARCIRSSRSSSGRPDLCATTAPTSGSTSSRRCSAGPAWRSARRCRCLAMLLSIDPGGRYQSPRLPAPALRARTLAALDATGRGVGGERSRACAGRRRALDRPDDGRMAGDAG